LVEHVIKNDFDCLFLSVSERYRKNIPIFEELGFRLHDKNIHPDLGYVTVLYLNLKEQNSFLINIFKLTNNNDDIDQGVIAEMKADLYKIVTNYVFKSVVTPDSAPKDRPEEITLSDYSTQKLNKGLQNYKLLVDGHDIDTGNYEFFPYADQVVQDFKATYKVIKSLKKGEHIPDNYNSFVHSRYCVGNTELYDQAIKSSHNASLSFRHVPAAKRARLIIDINAYLKEKSAKMKEIFLAEGHPELLADWQILGMISGTNAETINFYKSELTRTISTDDTNSTFLAQKPDGVVALCPPKNAAASNSMTGVFALLSGNSLIIKPPLRSPISTMFLWREIIFEVIKSHNLPEGILNIIIGNSQDIMEGWMNSPLVNDIIFFGDTSMGLEIGTRTLNKGKKAILELSGNDDLLIWKDADLDKAIDSAFNFFLGSGQICMVPKKVYIHEDVFDKVKALAAARIKEFKFGLPSDKNVSLTPVIRAQEFFEYLENAINKGAQLLCGGYKTDHTGQKNDRGMYITPTIITANDEIIRKTQLYCNEIFFPLLPLVKVCSANSGAEKDKDIFRKMISMNNDNPYGLRTSVWTESPRYIRKFAKHLDNSGLLYVNKRHVGWTNYLATHGGRGLSGGPYGEMNYFWKRTTHLQGISISRNK
ncbi:MAG: aldehyde dehydrogenase family protein, partial [Candidatus Margulisiibacteriota bacterium]